MNAKISQARNATTMRCKWSVNDAIQSDRYSAPYTSPVDDFRTEAKSVCASHWIPAARSFSGQIPNGVALGGGAVLATIWILLFVFVFVFVVIDTVRAGQAVLIEWLLGLWLRLGLNLKLGLRLQEELRWVLRLVLRLVLRMILRLVLRLVLVRWVRVVRRVVDLGLLLLLVVLIGWERWVIIRVIILTILSTGRVLSFRHLHCLHLLIHRGFGVRTFTGFIFRRCRSRRF